MPFFVEDEVRFRPPDLEWRAASALSLAQPRPCPWAEARLERASELRPPSAPRPLRCAALGGRQGALSPFSCGGRMGGWTWSWAAPKACFLQGFAEHTPQ